MALNEKHALVGVKAGRQQLGKELIGLFPQVVGVLPDGDGVQIDDTVTVVKLVAVLDVNPVLNRPQIISECDFPAGLDAAQTDLALFFHHCIAPFL